MISDDSMSGSPPRNPVPDTRSAEEVAAGNRRALLGCGAILLVGSLLVGGGLYALRSVTGGQKSQGEACASSGDCARGHVCAGSVFRATQTVCRKTCDESTECPSGRCDPILESQRAGIGGIGGFRGVCR